MLKILLIRPGATEYDRQGRIQGTLNVPLCEDGRQQVADALEQLEPHHPTALYTSPGQASTQTAEAIGKSLKLKPKTLDKLKNLDHGLWQGMLVEDVRSKQPKVYRQWQDQPMAVCPPQGETVMDAIQRTAVVLKKLMKRHRSTEGDDIVIALVAPEPLASVVRHIVRRDALGNLWKASQVCGKWELIDAPAVLMGA